LQTQTGGIVASSTQSQSPTGLYAARQHYRQTRRGATTEDDPKLALEYAYEYALEYGLNCALEDILQSPIEDVRKDPLKCGLKSSLDDALEWGLRYMLEDAPKNPSTANINFARGKALESAKSRIIESVIAEAMGTVEADESIKTEVKQKLASLLTARIDEAFMSAFDKSLKGDIGEPIPDGMFAWPVNSPQQYISSGFGFRGRTHGGAGHYHAGVDIVVPKGTPITSAAAGVITFAQATSSGYGNLIKVDHGDGYETWYAHLSAFNVNEGAQVAMGQKLGAAGDTGRATAPHLHYEVHRNGEPVDPEPYLP
jgi:murein DD-endopeptidase MepM/ murein hydrolase activator NlpD